MKKKYNSIISQSDKKVKCVLYLRYSSHNQTEQSIEGQREVCESYCESKGYEIKGEYIDRAKTGTKDDRPAFQEMIADAEAADWEVVLVYKLDRFARSRYDSAVYKRALKSYGVRVESATEAILDTPEGVILEGVLESIDEYYSRELARKVRRGQKLSREKGHITGNPPLGYKSVDSMPVVDEEKAKYVIEIFERYANGDSTYDIARDMKAIGIRECRGSVQWVLANTRYAGYYISKGDGERYPYPAIISEELFDKCTERREKAKKRYRSAKEGHEPYILTGIARCGKCGTTMCGNSHKRKGKPLQCSYFCRSCGMSISKSKAEYESMMAVKNALTEDRIQSIAHQAYVEQFKPVKDYSTEIASAQKKIDNVVDAIANIGYSDAMKAKLSELEAEKAGFERLQASVKKPTIATEMEIADFLRGACAAEIEQLLSDFVESITITRAKKYSKDVIFSVELKYGKSQDFARDVDFIRICI